MTNLLNNAEQDAVIRLSITSVFGILGLVAVMLVASGSQVAAVGTTINNPTTYVYNNSTVYANTTTAGANHWDNTTTYVNDSTSTTVFINTTYVVMIPVVNVTSITVVFANDTSANIAIDANYSLPIGTVTWLQFNVISTLCGQTSHLTVNAPWTMLSAASSTNQHNIGSDGTTTETVLIGVPYFPGTYAIIVTVS